MTEQAYSTDNPEAVAAFLAAQQAATEFARKVIADAAALGKNKGALRRGDGAFGGGYTTLGLAPDDPEDPPAGWVCSKTQDMLVPRRGKAGGQARQWLKDHQPPAEVDLRAAMEKHGLPLNDMLGAGPRSTRRINVPAIGHHDGTLWALYRGTPGHWAGGDDQPQITWTPRRLSEYYAAQEAREAADAAVTVGG